MIVRVSLPNFLEWFIRSCTLIQCYEICEHFLNDQSVFIWHIGCFGKVFNPVEDLVIIWNWFSWSNIKMFSDILLYMYNRFTCSKGAFEGKHALLLWLVRHGYWRILGMKLTLSVTCRACCGHSIYQPNIFIKFF